MSPGILKRCFGALLLFLPIPVLAQSAFTTQAVNMRAGPDRAFPLVTWLRPGTPVNVIGCGNGWRWCDVVAGGWRGWVYSRYLSGPIRGRAHPLRGLRRHDRRADRGKTHPTLVRPPADSGPARAAAGSRAGDHPPEDGPSEVGPHALRNEGMDQHFPVCPARRYNGRHENLNCP